MSIVTTSAPTHRRGQVVDDQILGAVIKVIEEAGTLSIKVDEVAEVAGVNKTTIYRRFPKRDDLVLAAVLAHADTSVPMPDEGSLRGDLLAVAQMVRDVVTSPLGKALLSASAASPELASLRSPFWNLRLGAATIVIDRAVERGECAAPDDPQLLIELLVAPVHFRASQIGESITDEFLDYQVERLLKDLPPAK